jgi:hypothetical protein
MKLINRLSADQSVDRRITGRAEGDCGRKSVVVSAYRQMRVDISWGFDIHWLGGMVHQPIPMARRQSDLRNRQGAGP